LLNSPLQQNLLIIIINNNNVTDEREDVQKKTFAKWINSQLLKVKDLVPITPFACYYTHSIYSRGCTVCGMREVSLLNLSMRGT